MSIKRFIAVAAVAAAAACAAPTAAQASCQGTRYTFNENGEMGVFKSLRPASGMNCASARYVMNNWLRPAYSMSWANRLPTRFYDGYVTWYCGKTSYLRWRCREYDSYTSFRFTAYHY
jgi:hypothetical protein